MPDYTPAMSDANTRKMFEHNPYDHSHEPRTSHNGVTPMRARIALFGHDDADVPYAHVCKHCGALYFPPEAS